jgi:succinyldiaminopimelate transaminase
VNDDGAVTPTPGFRPPPYPYDRLDGLRRKAEALPGGAVDLSIGTPYDPPSDAVVRALATSGAERGYPPSVGTEALRRAAAGWLQRRFGAEVDPAHVAACVGTKELVAGVPHWLRLRTPDRDTVLYPAVSYPSYAMGAMLAGCRAVPYDRLADVAEADAARALCLWVNSPANPTGELTDLPAAARWGRERGVPVLSDECYIEFTWRGPGRTIVSEGSDGVVAVHSLSKRSNLAGVRVGFYAGDPDLVHYLSEVRKHAGFMVPGPAQAAAVAALGDDAHVDDQRGRYRGRLDLLAGALEAAGIPCPLPDGAFYLWVPAPGGDAWALAERLATEAGAIVSPGEFYGPEGAGHVRIAVVQPDDRLALVAERLGVAAGDVPHVTPAPG